jgi:hypothetical protein
MAEMDLDEIDKRICDFEALGGEEVATTPIITLSSSPRSPLSSSSSGLLQAEAGLRRQTSSPRTIELYGSARARSRVPW